MLIKKFLALSLVFVLLLGSLPVLAATTQLPTPKNLQWNMEWQGKVYLGTVAWEDVPAAGGCFNIVVYRNGTKVADSKPRGMILTDGNSRQAYIIKSLSPDLFSVSGNYTFTIQAMGDNISYTDSAIATSPVYAFTAPAKKVATPTNLTWEKDGTLCYNGSVEEDGFYLEVYDQNKTLLCTSNYFFGDHELSSSKKKAYLGDSMSSWMSWNPNATGFFLRIRSYSSNIETAKNSDFSQFSDFYTLAENATAEKTLNTAWENALWGSDGAEKAVEQLKNEMTKYNITNQDLADSLRASEVMTGKFGQLEEAYCAETGTSVSIQEEDGDEGLLADNGIDIASVSVVGAALNSVEGLDVILSFSRPVETPTYDSRFYKKAIAVNMDMVGVADSNNLQIPVVVYIPLPNGVESGRFMILHYKKDGSVEKIYPTITYGDGIYATFILTSFSPFVFAEQAVAYDPIENWVTIGSDSYIENVTVLIGAYKEGILIAAGKTDTDIYEDDYNQVIFSGFDPTGADSVKVVVWKNDGSQKPLFPLCEMTLPSSDEE